MINNMKITHWKLALISILIVIFVLSSSFVYSRKTAQTLVGDSLKYFSLARVGITIEPIHRSKIVWLFVYSNEDYLDAEFEIYTSLFGKLAITNPQDLSVRLRQHENLKIHPYSNKNLKK